jgi:hypothetical protein
MIRKKPEKKPAQGGLFIGNFLDFPLQRKIGGAQEGRRV